MDFELQINGNILYIIPNDEFSTNKQYNINIEPGISGQFPPIGDVGIISENYNFWFTSIYCPQFTTAKRVRLQAGPAIDSFIDDTIFRMIHKNSIDAIDLYNISNSTNRSYNYWGCDWQDIPLQMKRYVECKTAYDILAILKMSNSFSNGPNSTKTLGDMNIGYSGSTETAPDPKKMAELYACWNDALRSFNGIQVAVKGFYDVSKGYSHPVRDVSRNRVIKPVTFNGSFTPGTQRWRSV